jgi:hypothetical protein
MHVGVGGDERVVNSLEEARRLSKSVAGSLGDKLAEDFFVEILPVRETLNVHVDGLRGECSPRTAFKAAERLAVRAAYCLGLDAARVAVGFGEGGPWVLRVDEVRHRGESPSGPIEFLGARSEFLAVDQRTGMPLHRYFSCGIGQDGRVVSWGPACVSEHRWVSSPMPYPGMSLSTALTFRGEPTSQFLRRLDRSVGLFGMLVSPADEVRERNATEEGLLGAYRAVGDGSFEYLCVPSLLWNPPAAQALCEIAELECREYAKGEAGRKALPQENLPLSERLPDIYEFCRVYYHADKRRDKGAPGVEGRSLGQALDNAFAPISGQNPDYRSDFRLAWGKRVSQFSEACVAVGPESAFVHLPQSHSCSVDVSAGARSEVISGSGVLTPDVLDRDSFDHVSPAWAPSIAIRPNPVAAQSLALPADSVYRASVSAGCASVSSARFRIGPIIGIMAPLSRDKGGRFGIETDRFKRMILLGASMGLLVYLFYPGEVDRDAGLVTGWTYRERRGWRSEMLPLPDVVYDRHIPAVSSSGKVTDAADEFAEKCPKAQFVNSLPFVRACRDKLRAGSLLAPLAAKGLNFPDTAPAEDPSAAAAFIAGRERSFLKMRGGTGSKGLALVENLGSSYKITRREKGRPPEVSVVSGRDGLEAAVAGILKSPGGIFGDYIVQEAIDMAKLPDDAGSTFEVRVIYQKGGSGRWLRTGMVCRVNPTAERFMIPGEEVHRRVDDTLSLIFPGRVNEVKERVRSAAKWVPSVLEASAGPGGEMSIDLGIDREGRPWLIEVNSKPATLFRDIAAFKLRELSMLRVLNYAIHMFHERYGEG